jgi:hypothetical protein
MNALVGDQWKISRAQQVRNAMGPDMCSVADALRLAFDAKIVWLQTPLLTLGEEPDWGVPTQWHGERKRT